jgi:hypothetical protein
MEHELKTLPAYYDPVARGEKTFEVRRDDRGFQKGDTLILREFLRNPPGLTQYERECNQYTGRSLRCKVLWVLTGGQFGVEPGYVVMAIEADRLATQEGGR